VETGDYRSAIRAYQEAIRLTPQYSYLPYNLGLVYQRLNRRKDAETAYTKAEMLAPNSAEPYNALGTLKASEGKRTDAEQLYRQALQKIQVCCRRVTTWRCYWRIRRAVRRKPSIFGART
jgi:Flp pilus assembly protein TadD